MHSVVRYHHTIVNIQVSRSVFWTESSHYYGPDYETMVCIFITMDFNRVYMSGKSLIRLMKFSLVAATTNDNEVSRCYIKYIIHFHKVSEKLIFNFLQNFHHRQQPKTFLIGDSVSISMLSSFPY